MCDNKLLLVRTTLALTVLFTGQGFAVNEEWPPITPEDLALRHVPGLPGEHAIILQREEQTDDTRSVTRYHYRIKILTPEGCKFADVEIPQWGGQVDEIHARVVHQDGSVLNFEGEVYDKTLIRSRGLRISVKAFALPEVQPGSIIEYRYRRKWPRSLAGSTVWDIQDQLFTRRASFSFKPLPDAVLRWELRNLPTQLEPRLQSGGAYHLDLENVPAFIEEDLMPPPAIVKPRIEFFYQSPFASWYLVCDYLSRAVDRFTGKLKSLEPVATQTAPGPEPPETRLRKLYARAQQIRNLDFEPARSRKEAKQENLKENGSAEGVLKRGYGTGREINLLFLALARAAGFEAKEILVGTRNSRLFSEQEVSMGQLNAWLVEVNAGGKTYYLDPATRFCPFGLLSWEQTGVRGIRVTTANSIFVQTPQPASADAVLERRGMLDLDDEGTLRGHIDVIFRGQEALQRRLSAREMTESDRLKGMHAEMSRWFAVDAAVKLDRVSGWDGSDESLKVEVTVSIPQFASATGRRLLLPATPFKANQKDTFRHANRVHPVYMPYPYQEIDKLELRLPEGVRLASLPAPQQSGFDSAQYQTSFRVEAPDRLILERRLVVEGYFFKTEHYTSVRAFYENVRKGDEQQLVLQTQH
jgi:transglutaminase-like putative cysteine protease